MCQATIKALDFSSRKCFEYIPQLYAEQDGKIGWSGLWDAVHDERELREFFRAADANSDGALPCT